MVTANSRKTRTVMKMVAHGEPDDLQAILDFYPGWPLLLRSAYPRKAAGTETPSFAPRSFGIYKRKQVLQTHGQETRLHGRYAVLAPPARAFPPRRKE